MTQEVIERNDLFPMRRTQVARASKLISLMSLGFWRTNDTNTYQD